MTAEEIRTLRGRERAFLQLVIGTKGTDEKSDPELCYRDFERWNKVVAQRQEGAGSGGV